MGEEKPPGERMAVLETEMRQVRTEIENIKHRQSKLTMHDLLVLISVIGTLVVVVSKGLGWTK
jgi:hypothetical protein